jgi:hypothetical protein
LTAINLKDIIVAADINNFKHMEHRIVCTTQKPADQDHEHAHIVSVGIDTDNDGVANKKMTLSDVLQKINQNDKFYTIGENSKKKIFVQTIYCCNKKYIRTKPDNYKDNNLDNLRRCQWK